MTFPQYFSFQLLFLFLINGILYNQSELYSQEIPFKTVVIDSQMAGDCKLVGDIDNDGFDDLIIGGGIGENLKWYHYPNWTVTEIAVPFDEFTTDAALADMDNDGDLDIIVPDGGDGDNLKLFFNPLPTGNPFNGVEWVVDSIGAIGRVGKDVQIADFDSDGKLDVATRHRNAAMIFFQGDSSDWEKVGISVGKLGIEGMTIGDIDQDTHTDLVFQGVWLKNPGSSDSRTANWNEFTIGDIHPEYKALVTDLNQDGIVDIVFSSSESTFDVRRFTPSTGDPTGSWTSNLVVSNLNRCHTIQAADMDKDGDIDLVLAQMHTSPEKEIMVYKNLDGDATLWEKQVIGTSGVHNAVVADIGNDGDFDIFGSNWTGNPPLHLWENVLSPIDEWQYTEITSNHRRTFGLTFGKVNSDDYADIVSGRFWYRNPGDLSIPGWTRTFLPSGMEAALMIDVDDDSLADILAMKDEGNIAIYWLEATDTSGASWTELKIGEVQEASHSLGSQGHKIGELVGGGKPEIVFSSGDGIYYFEIPVNPDTSTWTKVRVSSNPSDEGFGIGDIDNDGFADIAATTGSSKTVEWYKNPGDSSADWTAFQLGTVAEINFPDRCEIGDLSGDGKLDVIVTEENGDPAEAKTYWWEQPSSPMNTSWPRHLLTTQATTHSLSLADIDNDNDLDIITGEHRGDERVRIWENRDSDTSFVGHTIAINKESHLGTKLYDLNNDGVLEIVSIAWDDPGFIHLWRNDSLASLIPQESCVTFNFDVTGGAWYLVSLPVIPDDNTLSAVFPGAIAAFGWDFANQTYETATTLEPRRAYWLLFQTEAVVEVCGVVVNSYETNYTSQGWDMIGSVRGVSQTVTTEPPNSILAVFGWNETQQNYYTVNPFEVNEKQGYWGLIFDVPNIMTVGGAAPMLTITGQQNLEDFYETYGQLPPALPVYVSVNSPGSVLPGTFGLSHNYPNPFNPETRIEFDIPENVNGAVPVKLVIVNITGQVVKVILNESKSAGSYNVKWNGKSDQGIQMPSGVYFYFLHAGDFKDTKKMLLLK